MPNFYELHEHARKLADLTAPGQQHPGLHTWGQFVCEEWRAIVTMWSPDSAGVPLAARCAHCGDLLTADQAWGHNCGGPSRVPGLSPEALSAEFDKWWVRHEPVHSDGQRPAFMDGYRLGLNALNAAVRSLPPEPPKSTHGWLTRLDGWGAITPLHLVVVGFLVGVIVGLLK